MNLTQLRMEDSVKYNLLIDCIVNYPLREVAATTGDIIIRRSLRTLQRKVRDDYGVEMSIFGLSMVRKRHGKGKYIYTPNETLAESLRFWL